MGSKKTKLARKRQTFMSAPAIRSRISLDSIPIEVFAAHLVPVLFDPIVIAHICRRWKSYLDKSYRFLVENYRNPTWALARYTSGIPIKKLSSARAQLRWIYAQVVRDARAAYILVRLPVRITLHLYQLKALSEEIARRRQNPYPALAHLLSRPVETPTGIPVAVMGNLNPQTPFEALCDAAEKRVRQIDEGIVRNQNNPPQLYILHRIRDAIFTRMAQVWENWDGPPQRR